MKRGEGLERPFDIDELGPDEAEIGAMLRSYYRRHPSQEVMAAHLLELRQAAEAERPANTNNRAGLTVLITSAAACLLIGLLILVGPLRNRTEATEDRLDDPAANLDTPSQLSTPAEGPEAVDQDDGTTAVTGRFHAESATTLPDSPRSAAPQPSSTTQTATAVGPSATAQPSTTVAISTASTQSSSGDPASSTPTSTIESPQTVVPPSLLLPPSTTRETVPQTNPSITLPPATAAPTSTPTTIAPTTATTRPATTAAPTTIAQRRPRRRQLRRRQLRRQRRALPQPEG